MIVKIHIGMLAKAVNDSPSKKRNLILTNLRIHAAKELLADPFLAAAEIANMVGYESPNYFTRVFKKTTGMTPTEYRRLHAGAGKDGSE